MDEDFAKAKSIVGEIRTVQILLCLADFIENGLRSRVGEAEFLRELIGHFHKIVFQRVGLTVEVT